MNPRIIPMSLSFNHELPRDYVVSIDFVVQAGAIRVNRAAVHNGKDWEDVPLWLFDAIRESTAVVDMIGREGDAIRQEWSEAA